MDHNKEDNYGEDIKGSHFDLQTATEVHSFYLEEKEITICGTFTLPKTNPHENISNVMEWQID